MSNKRHPFNDVLTLTAADTEYSYTFPIGTVSIQLKSRSGTRIKLAWTSGASGTTYFSVGEGASYAEDGLNIAGRDALSIYAQCAVAGEVLELVSWRA